MRRTKAEAKETREALLEAAERVFLEKGVSGTSLTDIANAAALTRGAIYWHFADKAALLEAMLERGRLPQEYVFKLFARSKDGNPLDVVHEVAIDGLRHFAANDRSQRVCTIMMLRCEFVGEMSDVLLRLREADRQLYEAVRDAFIQAEERGLLSRDWTAETATLAHISTMTGLVTQWLRSDRCFDLLKVSEGMLEAMRKGFAAAPIPGERCERTFAVG